MLKEIIKSKIEESNNITLVFKNLDNANKVYDELVKNGLNDKDVENWTENDNGFYYFSIPSKFKKLVVTKLKKEFELYLCNN